MPTETTADTAQTVLDRVRAGYAAIATGKRSSCCGSAPCGESPRLTERIGYAADELAALPEGADLGLSCGNPTALASLQPGEVLLDLGSGAGLDCFLAGPKVGPTGRVIGVDMTPEMIARARRGLAEYRERTSLTNVEFRLGEIEHLPVADASVDVVISNCVLNLSPDKPQVWREIARVLRPGGRVAVSDLALLRLLPDAVRGLVEAWVGCIAGAVSIDDTIRMAREAGLTDVVATPNPAYVKTLADLQDPLYQGIAAALPPDVTLGDYIASVNVQARK